MESWQEVEKTIKRISEVVWCSPAAPETINGVKCDCVLKIRPDYWILVEVSESTTLTKLRTDLAKFATVRPFLFSQNIFSECFFVSLDEQTSLIESGKGQNVEVHSPSTFATKFIGGGWGQTRMVGAGVRLE
ncbi:MAG: hypothetical protein OEW08_12585 [Gammaproteobacteria bacterium]|nr:hypothetical protein [Gammaproteobacteria bacterium]